MIRKETLHDSSKKRETHYGTGRRKTSAARVFLKTLGTGRITVNNRPLAPPESAAAVSAEAAEPAPAASSAASALAGESLSQNPPETETRPPEKSEKAALAKSPAPQAAAKPAAAAGGKAPYFAKPAQIQTVLSPLKLLNKEKSFDIAATVKGGGATGQAEALRHGIARSLLKADSSCRAALKEKGFLTRDSRMVERKKYGLRKARKSPQFSKR